MDQKPTLGVHLMILEGKRNTRQLFQQIPFCWVSKPEFNNLYISILLIKLFIELGMANPVNALPDIDIKILNTIV